MKKPFFPFELGLEYENWEFDLEPIIDRINGYDSYTYIREIEIFGIKPKRIELVFHWDILVAIILQIKENDLSKAEKLIDFKQIGYYYYLSEKKKIKSILRYIILYYVSTFQFVDIICYSRFSNFIS